MIELNFPNAVRERNDLFGRDREITRAMQALTSRSRRPVVILGERLIGKTSLQQVVAGELENVADQQFAVLAPPPAYTLQAYAAEILGTIRDCLTMLSNGLDLTPQQMPISGATRAEYLAAYRNLLSSAPQRIFVLCIDEFDALVLKCAPEEQTAILDFTFYLAERSDLPLILLYTMNNPTDQIGQAYPIRFLSKASKIQLDPLSAADAAELAATLLAPHYTLNAAAQREILRLSGGHPYFTKLILQSLLDTFPSDSSETSVTETMVTKVLPHAINSLEATFSLRNVLDVHFSDREHRALKWLVDHGGKAPWNQVEPHRPAIQDLVQRGYLQKSAGDFVLFRVGFLYHWLQAYPFVLGVPSFEAASTPSAVADESELLIDDTQGRVYLKGEEIQFSSLEYRVLKCLGQRAGQLVEKEALAREAWPDEVYRQGFGDARIDAVIYRLRKKLGDDADNPTYLETRPGLGYVLHNATYIPASNE